MNRGYTDKHTDYYIYIYIYESKRCGQVEPNPCCSQSHDASAYSVSRPLGPKHVIVPIGCGFT